MKPSLKIVLLIITVMIVSAAVSCSGSQGASELDKVPIRDIKQRINQNSSIIETLEASGNIAFDSPEQSGTGWIEIKVKKPDSVYVKIEGPFGISIANALITRNDFIYYNVQENKVITGPSTDNNIGAILRIKISFDDLINGFTGAFEFENMPEDSLSATSDENFYILSIEKSGGRQKYFIEPVKYTIKKYNYLDSDNTSLVEVDYSNYQEEQLADKSVTFPTTIKIKNPHKKQTVYLDYVNKEINKRDLSFKIKVPKSAKVIKWD